MEERDDHLVGLNLTVNTNTTEQPSTKRGYLKRPDNWREIAQEHLIFKSIDRTLKKFGLFKIHPSIDHWYKTLQRWGKDVAKEKEFVCVGRKPIYGTAIDCMLRDKVDNYFAHGLPMTDYILKLMLLELLDEDTLAMVRCGKLRFGQSWAMRFYKRHNLRSRVATTKMRDTVPADYDAKRLQYLHILSKTLHNHSIPNSLIAGVDETNAQFVPSVKRTRCRRGTKRVRLVGVGKEKPQNTTTFGGIATDDLLEPVQNIFGGTTTGCHPNKGRTPPPMGQYYAHTKSHWQSDVTFGDYIEKAIVPYKDRIIRKEQLPESQKMCLILDLHWSHKTVEILALLKDHNIVPVFIPAGCTDLHQVCDLVMNKPFKNGVSNAFISYVSAEYEAFCHNPPPDDIFRLNMALSKLKPLLPNFVGEGLKALKTEAMKATIAKSFIDGGLIELARDPDVIAAAVANNHVIAVPVEVEEEEDLGPVEDPTDEAAGEDFDVEAVEEEVQDAIDDEMNDMNDDEMDDMIDDHDGTIEAIAEEVL